MEYFKQPIRPDLVPETASDAALGHGSDEEPGPDPDQDFLADAEFGETSGSRFRARFGVSRATRAPSSPFSSHVPRLSRPPLHRRLGLDNKALAVLAVAFLLVAGSVAAFALSGGDRAVAGDVPPPSTVTTFPAFPTASVMPPADAEEQPDGGVILAPELTGDKDTGEDPGDDPDAESVAAPPEEEEGTEQPDVATPGPLPGEQRRQGAGSGTGRAAGTASAPVQGYVITAAYAQAGTWSTGHHTGVDLAVPVGTPVVAVRAGAVLMSATDAGYGHYLLIRHSEHEYSLYAHLSRLEVERGTTVAAGQQIGLSGATGNVTGPHLHFEVRTEPVFGSDVDPVAYLASFGIHL
ncbi:peptidoglycan DD-metalloendopeptidase family protein [Streptomyces sp. NBC_00080]|uniref:M23 family metallopeptidase n=1 Tax=unclassified Streptomyces TaxID=2593676 RepID=UPI001171B215|nr:M23 family metallopeptidase [Streptomyces sp. SLBN-115]TQJ46547.1 peptidase M23-like protein [Streptomyces sp. SLBN-115]